MLNDKKNQNDHLKWVKLSGAMADIINLITSKLEFFLYYDFVKNAQAKSFQDQKIISLKGSPLSFWFQWKLSIYSTRWNTKWSLGSSVLYNIYCFCSVQGCEGLSLTWIICCCIWLHESWQICSIGLPGTNFWKIQESPSLNYHN